MPSATVFHCLLMVGCAVVFMVVYGVGCRLTSHPWAAAVPLMLLAAAEAALGLFQLAQGVKLESRIMGTYPVQNHYAGFLEMVLPFAALLPVAMLSATVPKSRQGTPAGPLLLACLCLGCAALILAGILYSSSRMGFVVALTSMSFVGLAAFARERPWRQIWPVLVAAPILAALAVVFLSPDALIARFADTDASRVPVWRDTLPLIAAYPVFGCGLGGYQSAFFKYKNSNPAFDQDYAHNDYLQYFAELGLVGFLIAGGPLAFLLVRLRTTWARPPNPDIGWLSLACAGSVLAIGLHSVVDFNLYVPANMFVFAWVLGIAAYSGRSNRKSASKAVR